MKNMSEIDCLLLRAPITPFIESLKDFYETRGFLSDKQLSRLRDVVANQKHRKHRQQFDGVDHDQEIEISGENGGVDWGF